jgi:enoyl-CoA hydratase
MLSTGGGLYYRIGQLHETGVPGRPQTFSKAHIVFTIAVHEGAYTEGHFFFALFLMQSFRMYQTLLTTLEAGIFTITINRPDKLNALNKQVFDDLDAAIDEVERTTAIKAVIITGAGTKAFVAGADISEFNTLDGAAGMKLARRGQDVFFRIENNRKPIIAAVNGFALGGGCELAMACHFRVASDSAKFGQPEVNLGLVPGYGGTQRLVQLIGKGRALELLLTGNMVDAKTALQYGLVNYVVPQEELLSKTLSLLQSISAKAPLALSKCITAANAVFDERLNGYEVELEAFGDCFETEDMKEGAAAFLEKRKPVFKGK